MRRHKVLSNRQNIQHLVAPFSPLQEDFAEYVSSQKLSQVAYCILWSIELFIELFIHLFLKYLLSPHD